MNIADHLLEHGRTEAVALVDDAGEHTYADLRRRSATVAAQLSSLGLPPGSRIALLAPNSMFWVAAYLAVMKLGYVVVPFSDKATAEEMQRNLTVAECSAVCIDQRMLRRHSAVFSALPMVTSEPQQVPAEPYWPESITDADTDAILMFTSGTTSTPKAVRLTHGNVRANTTSIIEYLGIVDTDRVLAILPFFYCFGASLLHTHLRRGARVVLCNTFAYPETAVEMLDSHAITVFAGVPSSYQLLLRTTTYSRRLLPSLRIVQQAGGKLPPVMISELMAAQPSASVFVMYGQTEATARLSYLPPDVLTEKMGSIGRGIPGVELRVLDENLDPVGPGVRGEIYARGDNISPGYFRDPVGSADKFTAHGLRTGDLAVVDDDGYIFVVDRRDDFIKSWGHRVSSQEVEAAALQLPDLVSAAAIGLPDEVAGEAITLFVTTASASSLSIDDVLSHCRSVLPKHMVPQRVHVLDALPLNANGKTSKNALRDLARAQTTSE